MNTIKIKMLKKFDLMKVLENIYEKTILNLHIILPKLV